MVSRPDSIRFLAIAVLCRGSGSGESRFTAETQGRRVKPKKK